MTDQWAPKIGVISMTYDRPITAAHFPLFERMRRSGMEFCELLVPEDGEVDPAAAGRAARDAGLSIVLAARINVDRDLASDDAGSRQAGVDYLRRCVDVAVACGADLVGGPLFGTPLVFAGRPPRPFDAAQKAERVDRVTAGLRAAAPYAEEHGVRLAIEPLNRFETDFCNTGRQACALADMVGSKAVGVSIDDFYLTFQVSNTLNLGPYCYSKCLAKNPL